MNLEILNKRANELRKKTFNAFIEKGEAHLGGSFSMIEILIMIYERPHNKQCRIMGISCQKESRHVLLPFLTQRQYQ